MPPPGQKIAERIIALKAAYCRRQIRLSFYLSGFHEKP